MTITRGDVEAWYEFQRDTRDIIRTRDGTNNGTSPNTDSPFDKLIGSQEFVRSNSEHISLSNSASYFSYFHSTQKATISLWYKLSSKNAGGSQSARQILLGNNDLGSSNRGFILWYTPSTDAIKFTMSNGSSFEVDYEVHQAPSTGQWYHLTITLDGSQSVSYVDGSQTNTDSISVGTSSGNADRDYEFGENPQDNNWYFDGKIANAVFLNRAATSTEVSTLSGGITARGQFPLTDNLEAYYKFDGNADDATGNGNDGTVNGATTTSPGRIGDAYSFDGSSDFIEAKNFSFIGNDKDFSIGAWFKTGSNSQAIIRQYDGTQDLYQIYHNSSNEIQWRVGHVGGNEHSITEGSSTNDGEWHHAVVVYKGSLSTPESELYVDGELKATGSGEVDAFAFEAPYIGAGSDDSQYFSGDIDEVFFSSRGLTGGEVRRIYSYGTGLRYEDFDKEHPLNDGVISAYSFDGDVQDDNNNTFDATNQGTVDSTDGIVGNSRSFDGSSQYIDNNVESITNGEFSVGLWAKPDSSRQGNVAFGQGIPNSWSNETILFYVGSSFVDKEWRLWWDGDNVIESDNAASAAVGNYQQYGVTKDNNNNFEVYVDGTLAKTGSKSNTWESTASLFGAGDSAGTIDQYFTGVIDIPVIWKRVLATTEWAEYYNSGSGEQFPYTFAPENVPGKVFKTVNGVKQTVASAVFDTK